MTDNHQHAWNTYRERELRELTPLLRTLGFSLDAVQVHTAGERFLMVGERDVGGGGYKLVLTGVRESDRTPVVLKVSSTPQGKREIETERLARETLRRLNFAYHTLFAPKELHFSRGAQVILATEFIRQDRTFLERPIKEQFSLALRALKAQEGVHATTYSHARVIRNIFGMWGASEYLNSFARFRQSALAAASAHRTLAEALQKGTDYLEEHRQTIEQYCGFLTHADFLPHNMRVVHDTTYLLDSASLHFGNKYESWGRFLNFMLLYNRPLEEALTRYVEDNRTPEESLSLRLMRVYKLGKLLEYHATAARKTSGDLRALSLRRVDFWSEMLTSLVDGIRVPDETIAAYKADRDALRSDEEKLRQKALH